MLFKNLQRPRERLSLSSAQRSIFRRQTLLIVLGAVFIIFIVPAFFFSHRKSPPPEPYRPGHPPTKKPNSLQEDRLHVQPLDHEQLAHFRVLMPAPKANLDFCKTLLTSSVLGYPVPTLIAWNQTFHNDKLLDGGRHMAKISGVLEVLEALPVVANNDLVLVMDAYDIWFQLRVEVLLQRFHAMNANANKLLKDRLGKAVEKEKIKQSVIFGASKECSPNQPHTAACYPVPESPLPEDLYGLNTDTIMGRDSHSSHRTRFLDSGYIMGSVDDVRAIFRRAMEKAKSKPDHTSWDNGSGSSDLNYHGSDQAIFHEIFGEQEFQREAMRRRHLSMGAKAKDMARKATWIDGTLIEDRLKPGFTHEILEEKSEKPDEFGISVDYWNDLGHQTAHSEGDARWLIYNRPIPEQAAQRRLFDCAPRVTGSLPQDMLNTTLPRAAVSDASQFSPNRGWDEVSLYTNLCLDTIPVMIHHNSEVDSRVDAWPNLWIQPHARRLMEEILERGASDSEGQRGGAYTARGHYLKWHDLCPAKLEPKLYGDAAVDP